MKYYTLLLFCLCLLILSFTGCDRNSDTEDEIVQPLPSQKIAGVWLGYLHLEDNNFYFGIVSEENKTILVGMDSQFEGPDGALYITPNTIVVQGTLTELIMSYSTTDFVVSGQPESWYFVGSLWGTLLLGSYQNGSGNLESAFEFIYNTTYDVVPKIANISGTWAFANTMGVSGSTISLIITPSEENTTHGEIQVKRDSGGDMFQSGTISIHYSNTVPYNIYDVSLTTLDGIELTGLAAYVEEVSTEGIDVPKTMAIGVHGTHNGTYRSFTGLATKTD